MKKIAILGSTGSIGTQTLEIVRENKDIEVLGIAARDNIQLLEKQIREFSPKVAAVWSEEKALELRSMVADTDTEIVSGMDGLIRVSTLPQVEILVTAIVGMIGIRPTMEAIRAGKDIALANKETLVTAGHLIMPLAEECGVKILPVDSEHSAIFQTLQGNEGNPVRKILLTASGGPFRGKKQEDLMYVQVEDALRHPNWSMGKKITIDSATLMNKGLEMIEARWLFGVKPQDIEVVIHPESIVHSMVSFQDGSVKAQLGLPDMKLPIQYALSFPQRLSLDVPRLDLTQTGNLHFEKPDTETFRCLPLAYQAIDKGGNMPCIMNAANEIAVQAFLEERIPFLAIADLIARTMERASFLPAPNIEELNESDAESRRLCQELIGTAFPS